MMKTLQITYFFQEFFIFYSKVNLRSRLICIRAKKKRSSVFISDLLFSDIFDIYINDFESAPALIISIISMSGF